jgi:hypothetical protein
MGMTVGGAPAGDVLSGLIGVPGDGAGAAAVSSLGSCDSGEGEGLGDVTWFSIFFRFL